MGCRFLSYVVGVDGSPRPVPDEVLAEMQAVPKRLEILRQRAIERRTIRVGDRARIAGGPLSGFVVDVTSVHEGIAHWLAGTIKGEVKVERLEKLHLQDVVAKSA